jgi:deoxyadenosine/deoxycytidine kinase
MPVHLFSVEGNIGSGKTTLVKELRRIYNGHPRVTIVDEPVNDWVQIVDPASGKNIIELFYGDQQRHAFAFQVMAYITRLRKLIEAFNRLKDSQEEHFVITERSLSTDRYVFAEMLRKSGKIEPAHFAIYLSYFDFFAKDFPIHTIIYVSTPPDVCHQRTIERARKGEDKIPLDYLQSCHEHHLAMISTMIRSTHTVRLISISNVDSYEEYIKQLHSMSQDLF